MVLSGLAWWTPYVGIPLVLAVALAVFACGEFERQYEWDHMNWKRGLRTEEPRRPNRLVRFFAFLSR